MEKIKKFTKTDKLIMASFRELVVNEPVERISASDVCKRANIRRSTFYNHFNSVSHLLACTLEDTRQQLVDSLIGVWEQEDKIKAIQQLVDLYFEFLERKRRTIIALNRLNGESSRFSRMVAGALCEVLKKIYMDNTMSMTIYADVTSAAMFASAGFAYISIGWVLGLTTYSEGDLKSSAIRFLLGKIFK